jgi:hypothetical protein
MKRLISSIVVSALALVGGAVVGGPSAYAATTPTIVLSGGSAVFGVGSAVIKGTASTAGAVKFSAAGAVITGCEAVATTLVTPFVANCTWVPKAAGSTVLTATLTPTDLAGFTVVDAVPFTVKVGLPVQGAADISPIHIFVDQVLASGSTGVLAPRFGVSCAVTSQFILGQTVVWRVYANNEALGGAVMDSSNTAQAYIEVAGIKDPIPMAYGNHSGVAFWTGVLATGAAPKYSTLGVINFKVTMIAKDQDTMKVASTKLVRKQVGGKNVMVDGRPVYERVSSFKTVSVNPPLKGAVGTWQSNFTASSQLTLYAVPTA